MKVFISILIVATLVALASGLVYLVKDRSSEKRLLRSLTIRIGLSLFIFALLIIGYLLGYLQPHGIAPSG